MTASNVKIADLCTAHSSNLKQNALPVAGKYPVFGASGYITSIESFGEEKEYVGIVKDGAGVGRVTLLPGHSSVIGTMQYICPNERTSAKYLYYLLSSIDFSLYVTGATIPHLYFKDYKKIIVPDHPIGEQKIIISMLSHVQDIIDCYRHMINYFDKIVKSRFIEMFGDPISNSNMWSKKQLKYLTTKIGSGATPKGGKESYIDKGITLIRSMNVYNGHFKYDDLAHITENQAAQLDNVTLEEDDVLLNITGASVARSCILPSKLLPGRVNQHVSIIRCNEEINPLFINHLLISNVFQQLLLSIARAGGATREAITKDQLESLLIICPPIDLQNQFADFVKQVDKSKFAVQQSLEKTELLYRSLMNEYFGQP